MTDLKSRLARVPLDRRMRFLDLLRTSGDGTVPDRPVRRRRGLTAPLSYSQNLLWFLDRLTPGVPAYNLVFGMWLSGPLDAAALEAALAEVVARHETLRTSLRDSAEGPVQVIASEVPVRLPVVPVTGVDGREVHERARELAERAAQRPFDLGDGPLWRAELLRVAPEEHLFVFVVHHVVFDAVSAQVFLAEIVELYAAHRQGRAPDLPDLPVQFADFAIWQREWLSGARLDDLLRFWRERLRDAPVLELPTDRPRPTEFSYRGANALNPVEGRLIEGAHRLAREMGVTLYPVYVAAFAELLRRYARQDDLLIGCSTSVRGRLELQPLIGFFVNMLALRVDAGGAPTFRELVRRTDAVLRDSFARVDLPFERVVQEVAPIRDPSRSPLVQVAFLMPDQARTMELEGLRVEFEEPDTNTTKFDMTWQLTEAGDESSLNVEYSTDLFDQATVDSMVGHYCELLAALVADPDRRAAEVDIPAGQEQVELLERWNGPVRSVEDATVHEVFAARAAKTPGAVAVVAGDDRLTYGELNAAADRLAALLREHGAGPGRLVALCLPRGLDYPVAALAVLKSGAAFVPIDPEAPADRIAKLLADAEPCAVVTRSAHPGLPFGGPVELVLDDLADDLAARADGDSPPLSGPQDLAYVLYTSGSAGTPKGVRIRHRSVVNFVASVRELFDLTPDDSVLGYAAHTFDVSVFEMFAALLAGARLHVALEAERLDLDRLQDLLEEAGITVIDLPPAVMALLDPARLDRLRISFAGGEAFPGDLVNRWNKVSRFFNGYGPTECTVTMIVQECEGEWDGSPPIGLPMANHVAHVLDDDLRLVPYGVPGELVIGGEGLADGYLNRPELTREKFVPDPFGTAPGGRLYRTGDLVKRRRDGAIVFLGRVDRQIKIRGVRIEPGEIEAVLAAHSEVRQAQVIPWSDAHGQRHLVAYVACVSGAPGIEAALRAAVAEKLPAAMVPQYVVVLTELPLTSSGKVDTSALPPPDTGLREGGAGAEPPATETERILAEELVGPVLRADVVDATANFFESGGSSLQAAQLISGIRRRFGVQITVADFFHDPTIRGLATVVDAQRAPSADDDLLAVIEAMSEEEVERIMDDRTGEGIG
ncbi:amino acid adenylation domain-containing protein [Nonomuraea sp. NPDC052116]|uniref:non-ribosomal peptide synthetase n=1 Tax=Nonomuraea sp. NPDC052116 TaxID=3155665 RepID=UPI0034421EA6